MCRKSLILLFIILLIYESVVIIKLFLTHRNIYKLLIRIIIKNKYLNKMFKETKKSEVKGLNPSRLIFKMKYKTHRLKEAKKTADKILNLLYYLEDLTGYRKNKIGRYIEDFKKIRFKTE